MHIPSCRLQIYFCMCVINEQHLLDKQKKQTRNKHETNTKQTRNKHETNTKQTRNKQETNTKQTNKQEEEA